MHQRTQSAAGPSRPLVAREKSAMPETPQREWPANGCAYGQPSGLRRAQLGRRKRQEGNIVTGGQRSRAKLKRGSRHHLAKSLERLSGCEPTIRRAARCAVRELERATRSIQPSFGRDGVLGFASGRGASVQTTWPSARSRGSRVAASRIMGRPSSRPVAAQGQYHSGTCRPSLVPKCMPPAYHRQ